MKLMQIKIEMDDNASRVSIVAIVAICLSTAIIAGCQGVEKTRRIAFENGNQEIQKGGTTGVYLGKPASK